MSAERHIAVAGDVHGHIDALVAAQRRQERALGLRLEAVLQVGDFEPHRHVDDLASLPVPLRHRRLGDFPAYHGGRERLPWPLYFIAGNHEPFAFLERLPQGGRVAANCHYLGRVGERRVAGLRVVGLSGIHCPEHYHQARSGPPFASQHELRRAACFRAEEVAAAVRLGSCDILLLHDWPAGSLDPADLQGLQERRPSLDPQRLGSAPARELLSALRPRLLCCGHLHLPWDSVLRHEDGDRTRFCALARAEQRGGIRIVRVADGRATLLDPFD